MFFILRFAALPESSWLHEDGSLGGLFTTLHFILLSSALFDFTCIFYSGLPWWLSGKEFTFQRSRRGFSPWVGKIPWRRKWQPIPVFLPEKSYGHRLAGHSSKGRKEVDMTEHLVMHARKVRIRRCFLNPTLFPRDFIFINATHQHKN